MTDTDADAAPDAGWFVGLPAGGDGDTVRIRERIATGSADVPRDWPRLAVESGFAETADDYYDRLHEAAIDATRETVRERERADDRQLVHAVQAMDNIARILV